MPSKDKTQCLRKLKHTDYFSALRHASALKDSRGVLIFPCDHCRGLHLGHEWLPLVEEEQNPQDEARNPAHLRRKIRNTMRRIRSTREKLKQEVDGQMEHRLAMRIGWLRHRLKGLRAELERITSREVGQ